MDVIEEMLKEMTVDCKTSITIFDTNKYIKYEDVILIIDKVKQLKNE